MTISHSLEFGFITSSGSGVPFPFRKLLTVHSTRSFLRFTLIISKAKTDVSALIFSVPTLTLPALTLITLIIILIKPLGAMWRKQKGV